MTTTSAAVTTTTHLSLRSKSLPPHPKYPFRFFSTSLTTGVPHSTISLSNLRHRSPPSLLSGKYGLTSEFFSEGNGGVSKKTSPVNRICASVNLRHRSPPLLAGKSGVTSELFAEGDGNDGERTKPPPRTLISQSINVNLRRRLPPLLAGKPGASTASFADGDGNCEESFVEFLTSERVKVAIMLALALALCNADRVVMSVAIVPLSLSYGWSTSFAGVVQSSFLWGYLVSPIAGGALVDYYGGKTIMGWGVALWSLATFFTPWAAEKSLWALLAMRAMVGIAEGVALPSMNNMVSKWFPKAERARAVGIAMAGFQLGSAIGLVLSPILMSNAGVYGPFVIFGLFGFLWFVVWLSATSSTPERSRQISAYELNYILTMRRQSPVSVSGKIRKAQVIPPFNKLLSKLPTWSLMVANGMHSWGFFVILSWMPLYFKSVYNVDLRQAAWFSAVPWTMMAFMGYVGGALSDMFIQHGLSVTLTRKIMQSIGFIGPAIALVGLTSASSPSLASAWLTLAVGLKSFSHSGFLVNIQEIAPQYTGILHGLANTAGTFAAILGTVGAGFFVELFGSFKRFLWLTSFLYVLAALFYDVFSTGELVDFDTSCSYVDL